MAVVFANRGLYNLLSLATTGSTDIRSLVLAGTAVPTAAVFRDLNFVSELLALGGGVAEAAAPYARADLAGVTVAEDDSGDRATLVATAPTYASTASGETWRAQVYYIEGASDAARPLICMDTPAATQLTNGGPITGPALSVQLTNP